MSDDEISELAQESQPEEPMKKVRNTRRPASKKENDMLDKLIVSKCSFGERKCRACAKGLDHKNLPDFVTCVWCGAVHHFYRLRTGRIRREKIYHEDSQGNRVPRYNKNGDFIGHAWHHGDKIYYEDGTPVAETKFTIACSNNSCKFFKIPIDEVKKYSDRTKGRLEKI